MDPVRTSDCNLVYKGPNEQIGDLWVHRVHPGLVRVTYEPTPEELDVLKAGGRVRLSIMNEPISPVMLSVVTKEDSEPVAPHGFKVDKRPGDKLEDKEKLSGEDNKEEAQAEDVSRTSGSTETLREAADAVSA